MDNLGNILDSAMFHGIPGCLIVMNWNLKVREVRVWVNGKVVCNRREDDDRADKKEGKNRQEYIECPPTVHGGE